MQGPAEPFSVAVGVALLRGDAWRSGLDRWIVLLHAGVADRRSWGAVATEMATWADAASYDRRGFGDTAASPEGYSHVDDLLAVLDHLDIASCWLVGSSQGGRIAIDAALRSPERVEGLILAAPAVSGAPPVDTYPGDVARLVKLIDDAEDAGDLDAINRHETHLWLDGPGSPEGRVAGIARSLTLDMNGKALVVGDVGEEEAPTSAWERLGGISQPTLVISGDLDLPHVQDRARHVAAPITAAEICQVHGTAHLPYLEQPSRFEQCVRRFINRGEQREDG